MSKILIIDDEIGICLIMSKFLTKNGYTTSTAESGESAFLQLEKQKFDLVLSDFRLEDTDGREILRKIKSDYPNTPVIIVSGFGDPNLAAELISMGAFDFINKPIYPNVILDAVKKALEQQDKINQQSN